MRRSPVKYSNESAFVGESGFSRWIRPIERGYRLECCDCSLVHEINFAVVKDVSGKPRATFQVKRDSITTRVKRKEKIDGGNLGWADGMVKMAQAILTDLFSDPKLPRHSAETLLSVLQQDIVRHRRWKKRSAGRGNV